LCCCACFETIRFIIYRQQSWQLEVEKEVKVLDLPIQ